MENNIFGLVVTEIAKSLQCSVEDININTCADDIDTWDSMSNIILLIAIEKKFNIKFNGLEALSLENVGQLCELVENKLIN